MQVTISGNRAARDGGGIYTSGAGISIARSTIADNQADSDGNGSGFGGGLFDASNREMSIEQSIIGDNRLFASSDDWYASPSSQIRYSLVEKISGLLGATGAGNIFGVDPQLGPLEDNGGPEFLDGSRMLTHALLPGSPAIDAGDPTGGSAALSLAYRAEVVFDQPSRYYRFEGLVGINFTERTIGGHHFDWHVQRVRTPSFPRTCRMLPRRSRRGS